MIIEGYRLEVRCNNGDTDEAVNVSQGPTRSICRAAARRVGWVLSKDNMNAYCPNCRKKREECKSSNEYSEYSLYGISLEQFGTQLKAYNIKDFKSK